MPHLVTTTKSCKQQQTMDSMLQAKFLSVPSPTCVRMLLTSDVHLALDKVVKLGEWMWAGNSKREGYVNSVALSSLLAVVVVLLYLLGV